MLKKINFSKPVGHALIVTVFSVGLATNSFADDAKKESADNDPLEVVNRVTTGFNNLFRDVLLNPVVDLYQAVTPDPLETAISNAASNLTEPLTIGSSLLQGDTENAATATQRFLINSTVGIGGLTDPAKDMGLEQRREDLGQTMAKHGVEEGPYIVLPIIGPSNFRDAAGDLTTAILSPMPLVGTIASGGVEYSQKQDAINSIGENALDPYIAVREAYRQNRNYEIQNGEVLFPIFDEKIK